MPFENSDEKISSMNIETMPKNDGPNSGKAYRKGPYIILLFSIVLIGVGIYLTLHPVNIDNLDAKSEHLKSLVNGPSNIIIGVSFLGLYVWIMIKRYKARNKN